MREDEIVDGGKAHLRLVPARLSFKRLVMLHQIEDLGIQRVAVERPAPTEIDSRVAAGEGRSSTRQWFAGGHRHEPVSTRLKGLAEDGEGEVFCVHDPKLSFETPSCQEKMS